MRSAVATLLFCVATALSGLPVAERASLTVDGLGMAEWNSAIHWAQDGATWALDSDEGAAHLRITGMTVDPTLATSVRVAVVVFPDGPVRMLQFSDAEGEIIGVIALGTRIRGAGVGPVRISGIPGRTEVTIDRPSGPLVVTAGSQVILEPEGWTLALSAVRLNPWAADWWAWRTKR